MIQNFVSKHTAPMNLMPSLWKEYDVLRPANGALVPNAFLARFDVGGPKCVALTARYSVSGHNPISVCFSIAGTYFPSPTASFEVYAVVQDASLSLAGFDNKQSFNIFPIEISSSGSVLSFKDALSFVPGTSANGVPLDYHVGFAFFITSGNVRGLGSVDLVLTDDPVYQPNK